MSVLDPSAVAALSDLELVARLIVEGNRPGPHRSPFHGFSTEFQQHRSYRPGDDLRHLDWKLLGRTDRLYTRQFRDTTNMSIMLVLDASASMGFPEEGVSKLRYSTMVAAALAYLIVTSGDAVGLTIASGSSVSHLPARGGRAQMRSIVDRLERVTPAGTWTPARTISHAAGLLKRRGLLIVLSDFYDAEDETARELKRVLRRGHDVAMLHTMSRPEIAFDYRGDVEFRDLESGTTRVVGAGDVARRYRANVGNFLEGWRQRARREGIDYSLFTTDEPMARALRAYIVRRGSKPHAARHATGGPA